MGKSSESPKPRKNGRSKRVGRTGRAREIGDPRELGELGGMKNLLNTINTIINQRHIKQLFTKDILFQRKHVNPKLIKHLQFLSEKIKYKSGTNCNNHISILKSWCLPKLWGRVEPPTKSKKKSKITKKKKQN